MKAPALFIVGGMALLLPAFALATIYPSPALAAPVGRDAAGSRHAQTRVGKGSSHRSIATSSGAYAEGQRLLKAGKYGPAEAAFRQAIKAHDHLAAAYGGLGTAAIGSRQFTTALDAFTHATALAPRVPDYQYDAGYAALYSADYHKAVQFATGYIHLRPRDPKGYHLRFLAYGQLLQRKLQVVDAGQVVRFSPKSASAYNDLGIALSNDGKFQKSAIVLSYAISLDPKNPVYYANRGQAEFQLKQYASSLKDFRQARALTTDPARKKQYDPAIAYLQKVTHH